MAGDKEVFLEILKKRLGLPEAEFGELEKNPRFQRLFENAIKASGYTIVAEVVYSKGCHSGHVVGQRFYFDSAGNLLTKYAPPRVCSFIFPNLVALINVFFENLMNGRDPNEVIFNKTGCFDVGVNCGGWGHIVMEVKALSRDEIDFRR